jgi:hypothetical protein
METNPAGLQQLGHLAGSAFDLFDMFQHLTRHDYIKKFVREIVAAIDIYEPQNI